jgi:hypothetical protein
MVKIGIIYNEIFSEEIKTIYRYLTNLNFNVYVISSKHILLDIPNKILKDIEKCKDELYIDKINVYLNFDETQEINKHTLTLSYYHTIYPWKKEQ